MAKRQPERSEAAWRRVDCSLCHSGEYACIPASMRLKSLTVSRQRPTMFAVIHGSWFMVRGFMRDFFSSNDLYFEAVQAALQIEEPAETANMLLKIVASLHAAQNTEYASALLPKTLKRIRALTDPNECTYLLRLFIRLQCDMDRPDEAAAVLSLLEGDPEQDEVALFDVARAQARSGQIDVALHTAEKIDDLDDYETVLEAVGRYQARQRLFPQAVQTAAKIEAGEIRCRLLLQIGLEQWHSHRPDDALRSLRSAVTMGYGIAEPAARDRVFLQAVDGFIALHRVFEAMPPAGAIVDPVKRVEALCSIIVFLRRSGNAFGGQTTSIEAAMIARKIPDPAHRALALRRIGVVLHRIGESAEAREIFRETLAAVKSIRNTYSQTRAMTELGACLAELGIRDVAKRIFRLAVALAQTIEGFPFQFLCLCDIIEAQAAASLRDEAARTLALLEETRDEIPRRESAGGAFDRDCAIALGSLGAASLRASELEGAGAGKAFFRHAVDAAKRIGDPLNRALALQSLGEKLASAGH